MFIFASDRGLKKEVNFYVCDKYFRSILYTMSEIRSFKDFNKNLFSFEDPNYYVYCFPKCADVQQCFNKDWENLRETKQRKMLQKLFNDNAHGDYYNAPAKPLTEYDEYITICSKKYEKVILNMFMRHKNIDQYTKDEIPNWQTLLSKMQIIKTNMMPGKKPQSSGGIWFDEYVEEMYNTVKKFLKPSTKSRNPFAKKGPVTTFAEYLESKKIKEGKRNDILDIGIKPQDGISELAIPTAWGKRDLGRYEKRLARPTNWQAIDAVKLEYAKEFPNNSDVKELSRYSDFEELFSTEPEEEIKTEDIELEEEEEEKIPTAKPATETETATAIATAVGTEEEEEEAPAEKKTAQVPAPMPAQVPAPAPAAKTGTGSSTKVNFNLGSSSIASATGNSNAFSSSKSDGSMWIELFKLFLPKFGGNKSRRRNKKTRKSRKQQKSRRANKK